MKYISLFCLLLVSSFSYAQQNQVKVNNSSAVDITFTLKSFNTQNPGTCLPMIFNDVPVLLPSERGEFYKDHNSTYDASFPINQWRVLAKDGTNTVYNIPATSIDQSITDEVEWKQITITTPTGSYTLGLDCSGAGTNHIVAGGITMDLNYVGTIMNVDIN
ncbi:MULTISPECIES: hypothetical protein [unclassified Chryseobacterium]|uniref:hypothetical protein n=1 Tax=unclassified Chryseobacterium TaxID=2593645 RepID=UPI00226ABE86|nr:MULTISPECIES: hypothetical protein [unclassified Chryseobacterium]